MRFSSLTDRVAGGGATAWAVHDEAVAQREAGRAITFLTIGDPDQAGPAAVIEAARAGLAGQRKGYAPIAGLPAVRAAIAARIARRSGEPCGEANVVVTPGAQAALYIAMQCIAGPGDEVVAAEPIYATYGAVVGAAGARLVTVPLRPERGFHPDLADYARAITPRTRAIWINNPHNPTGAVLNGGELGAIAELCRRHDLWLLADEVYEDLAHARPHVSAWSLPQMADRTIVVSSLSKSHAIPGFRLGWAAGPPGFIGHAFNLVLCMLYGGPPFLQEAALPALTSDLPEAAGLREAYRRRAAAFSALLASAPGCRITPPEGGMFALLDVRPTGLTATAFARRLLDETAIAVLPCEAFGPSAAGHLRISLTLPDEALLDAGRRIVAFAARLAAEARAA
jgi:arginine:pyruvate transaminase